jgi:hypothetical protein
MVGLAAALVLLFGLIAVGSGCGDTWQGTWTPVKDTVSFMTTEGSSGWGWAPSAKPGGWLVIVKRGGGYGVMLVNDDGTHIAGTATPQGPNLLVRAGFTRFFLSQSRTPRRLDMEPDERGQPAWWLTIGL